MNNIALGRYLPLDSWMHKIDPRIKIMAMVFMLVAIFIPAGWWGYLTLGTVILFAFVTSKINLSYILKSFRPMLFMMIFLLVINIFVMKTGQVWLSLGNFKIYSDAIIQTAFIATRLILMISVTTLLTATTKPTDMTLGIEDLLKPFKRIGVPAHEIAMMISIALRFIPTLIEETNRIMQAQASRGVDFQEGSLKEKITAILSLIVPMFVGSFQRAEDLADAMEARGYAPGKARTRYKQLHIRLADWLFLISVLVLVVVLILLAIYVV